MASRRRRVSRKRLSRKGSRKGSRRQKAGFKPKNNVTIQYGNYGPSRQATYNGSSTSGLNFTDLKKNPIKLEYLRQGCKPATVRGSGEVRKLCAPY
jgi:hypothetical protein